MRRVFALIAALALVLVVAAPVAAADENQINNIVVTSVTRDSFGGLNIHGTAQCIGITDPFGNVQIQGDVRQAIGHKTTITGWLGGGTWCPEYGTVEWDAYAQPDWGSFSNGWITGSLNFTGNDCYDWGCQPNYGGTQFTFKVTKR